MLNISNFGKQLKWIILKHRVIVFINYSFDKSC